MTSTVYSMLLLHPLNKAERLLFHHTLTVLFKAHCGGVERQNYKYCVIVHNC